MGEYTAAILVLVGIAAFIGIFILIQWLLKRARSTCKNCGTRYTYDTDIRWEIISETAASDKKTVTVKFDCTCHNCATVKSFERAYVTEQYIKPTEKRAGYWKRDSIDNLVKNTFLTK